jgi:type 1 fimbria pilin
MSKLVSISSIDGWFDTLVRIRNFTTLRDLLMPVVCVLALCGVGTANAACSFLDGSFAAANVNFGSINVPKNVAVGSVIASKQASYDSIGVHQAFSCGNGVPSISTFAMSGAGTSGTYATNIPGIGLRVYIWSNTGGYYNMPASPALTPVSWNFTVSGGAMGTGYLQTRVDLVSTGPIDLSGSNALSYQVGSWLVVKASDGSSQITGSSLSVTAVVTALSCSVTTPDVAVTLPKAFVTNLPAIGATTGATVFALNVNCPRGVNVNVTFTDASNVSNRSTILGLAPGSSASGVGLQILGGSTPIAFGPDSARAGNINQWFAGVAAGGQMQIPLTAQYVRTPGTLIPGSVKGTITFTMSYQ